MTVYLRKTMVDGSTLLLEFRGRDLSAAGVFVAADDLTLLDLDEEVEVLLGTAGGPFATAPARTVRSVRSFAAGRGLTASGYGLVFVAADARFRAAIDYHLAARGGTGRRTENGEAPGWKGATSDRLPETGLEPARSVRTKGF